MSNQDLTELRDINDQIEKLQNQKRIIQQKLQDENDMMMVENHLFSQPDIQNLIQEIENNIPNLKININHKENEIIFSHNNHDFYKIGMPYLHLDKNKKELIANLKISLILCPLYMETVEFMLIMTKALKFVETNRQLLNLFWIILEERTKP